MCPLGGPKENLVLPGWPRIQFLRTAYELRVRVATQSTNFSSESSQSWLLGVELLDNQ